MQGIIDLIQLEHIIFIAENVGIHVLTEAEKEIIEALEEDLNYFPSVELAFKFGIFSEAKKGSKITYAKLKKLAKQNKLFPLSIEEKAALKAIETFSYNEIKGLGNKISRDFSQIFIESDQGLRAAYEKLIKKETKEAVSKRESQKQLVSRLGHKTGDWARDFHRISDYLMHHAHDHGRAQGIIRRHGNSKDPILVYKSVFAGACRHCIRLYLTDGIGSRPRVFKLSDLVANGSNIGRKANDWKAVLGPTHNWCRCQLEYVPKGFDWDAENKAFTKPKVEGRRVERKSKVKIKINDKEFNV